MAYVSPTPATFKARYPEFASVDDLLIGLVLEEAIRQIGEAWLERDRARAQMLLAAHTLTLEGEPARSVSGQGTAGTGPLKRRRVGDVETEFAGVASSASQAGGVVSSFYGSSLYGQHYLTLMRLNFPAIEVV